MHILPCDCDTICYGDRNGTDIVFFFFFVFFSGGPRCLKSLQNDIFLGIIMAEFFFFNVLCTGVCNTECKTARFFPHVVFSNKVSKLVLGF